MEAAKVGERQRSGAGGAVLLSELRMEQRLQLAVVGRSAVCTRCLPLPGSPETKREFIHLYKAGGFPWEILLPVLLTKGNSAPKRRARSLALQLSPAHKKEKPGLSSPGPASRLLGHPFPSI